jgi:hypothetical protein
MDFVNLSFINDISHSAPVCVGLYGRLDSLNDASELGTQGKLKEQKYLIQKIDDN